MLLGVDIHTAGQVCVANGVPVIFCKAGELIFCKAGERKHRIAEAYLAAHAVGVGVFLVLVAKAPAPVCCNKSTLGEFRSAWRCGSSRAR